MKKEKGAKGKEKARKSKVLIIIGLSFFLLALLLFLYISNILNTLTTLTSLTSFTVKDVKGATKNVKEINFVTDKNTELEIELDVPEGSLLKALTLSGRYKYNYSDNNGNNNDVNGNNNDFKVYLDAGKLYLILDGALLKELKNKSAGRFDITGKAIDALLGQEDINSEQEAKQNESKATEAENETNESLTIKLTIKNETAAGENLTTSTEPVAEQNESRQEQEAEQETLAQAQEQEQEVRTETKTIAKTISFNNVCIETCSLNLTENKYKLLIEIASGELEIDKIEYWVASREIEREEKGEEGMVNISKVNYELVEDDPGFNVVIDAVSYDNETGILSITFHHTSTKSMPIKIETQDSLSYELSQNFSIAEQKVTLIVYNFNPERDYFEIKVGEASEKIGFGAVPTYNVRIEVRKHEGLEDAVIIYEKANTIYEQSNNETIKLKKGKYNVKIIPASFPIKEIRFDVDIDNDFEGAVAIDDVPETAGPADSVEVYAIDPTALNFTEALVTITAKGNELWKCKEWDFTERKCNGEWTYLMAIVPGEDYSFTLTPEDPAYAELPPQYIIECTEGGAPGTCTFSYLATDDTQYEQFRVGKGAVINRLNVSVNSTFIPTNALITNATVCILAYRDSILGDDAGDACGIYAGENATGTPTYTVAVPKTQATCLNWSDVGGSPNAVCGDITSWLNSKPDPVASARKLIIIFDGTEQSDNNVDLWIDYMYANITYILKPNVTLVSPSNGSVTTSNAVNFTCNATDDLQLSNITFYWNYTGTWQANGTVAVSGTSNETTFERTNLSNGAILWNCQACDNESACSFAAANWTVTVNYNAPDNPPTVTLDHPQDNYYNDTSQYVNLTFNATVTDDYDLVNCSLWHNYTGTWHLNQTQTITGKNNVTNFSLNNLTNKTFIWNIQCYDNASQSAFAPANRTVKLNWTAAPSDNPPTTTLNAPVDNYWNDSAPYVNVTFNCSAADDIQLKNISLYITNATNQSFSLNQTTNISGTSNSSQWILTLGVGNYTWNCLAYDNASQSDWGDANRSLKINWTAPPNQAPQITLNLPANNTQFNNTQNINFNFTAIDDLNTILNCSIYLDNVLNQTNSSTANNTLTNFLINGISYGSHNWSVNCSDGELSNVSEIRYFTINDTIGPSIVFVSPTPNNNAVLSRDWVTINASVSDILSNIDACILEWNGSNESMTKVGSGTNVTCYTNKTGLTGNTNYTYKVYANDTSNNWNVSETRNVFIGIPPSVVILHPSPGEVFDEEDVVVLVANITDPDSLNLTVAEVTLPNSSKQNVTLYIPPNADNFDTNTVGIAWTIENHTGTDQICIADIDTTVPDMAYTAISGNGSPLTDTYCGLVSIYPVCKYFDMSISFNITHEEGIDYAMLFSLIENPSLLSSSKIIFMSIGNWTGYGRTYDVFINDGNISDYISERPTNDTYGKFRIKREGNNFTFYTWNHTANDWYEEAHVDNVNMPCALFINLEAETAETGWGSINVTWDNLTISAPELYEGVFSDTSISGIYNVTFIAIDNYGAINDTEHTYFNITEVNDAPTVPYILSPAPNDILSGTIRISWSNVYDEENDSLQFNITLLNPDYSENATIVTNYGNASTTSYDWNTTMFQDGNYSLKVVVFENETAEGLSSYSIMTGKFSIDNTPPAIEFVPPTETSGSTINRNYIQINVTADDEHLDYLEVFLYNSTHLLNQTMSVSSSYFVNFTSLSDGIYYFNSTAYDAAGNSNSTETRNVTIYFNQAPQITLNLPENNTQFNNTQDINFNFTATDDLNTTLSCSIYLDSALNQTNNSVQNNTLTNFLISGISYGSHNWSINCTDSELSNVSETRDFTIADTIAPSINFVSPTETSGSTINRDYIQVNVTASDAGSGLKNITIYLYNSTGNLINSSTSTSSPLFANFTNLPEGTYYFNATAYDNLNNSNSTETRNVTIDTTKPSIALNFPPQGFSTTATSINFNWTALDNLDSNLSCNLTIDGIVKASSIESLNSTSTNQTVSGFVVGSHQWNVTCWDDSNNTNTSETRNFSIIQAGGGGGAGGGEGAGGAINASEEIEKLKEKLREAEKIKEEASVVCEIKEPIEKFGIGECKRLAEGEAAYFIYEKVEHKIVINKINSDSVDITIYSLPIRFTIGVNQSKLVDITNDGIADIKISLDELDYERKKVSFTVKVLKCACPECSEWSKCVDGKQTRTCYNCSEATNFECIAYQESKECEKENKIADLGLILIFILAAFAILVIIKVIFLIKKRKEREISSKVKITFEKKEAF
ncbi:MAG: hypothetical protein QW199_00300 [Candidatus Pacearchaeota archaeon]